MTGSHPRPSLSRRSKILIGIGVGLLLLVLIAPRVVSLITDWLWYSSIGYTEVMSTTIVTRIVVFAVVAVFVAAVIFGAMYAAYRVRPDFVMLSSPNDPLARYRTTIGTRPKLMFALPAVLIGLMAGLIAQGSWATVQTFVNRESFGIKDPQFNMDIGFYAFSLPFFRMILDIVIIALVVAFIGNLVMHYVFGGIKLGGGGQRGSLTRAARVQLAVIAGLFMIAKAVGYWFDRYDLLYSDRRGDIFTGATYTDINFVLPSKLILMAIAIVCAIAFFAAIALRDLRIPALAAVLMLVSALIIGVIWPAAMEQFSVKPSAITKEDPYIQRNIQATTDAYRIRDDVDVTYEQNWTSTPAKPELVNADEPTLSNIRILDPDVVSRAFDQRQQLKNFYGFPKQLAVDRYPVKEKLPDSEQTVERQRDFVVAVRELDPSKYDANQQGWINKHTVYTHGNGFIAAQANKVDEASGADSRSDRGGQPVFLVSDLDTIGKPGYAQQPIQVKQPRIYFGELLANVNPDYAIVGSADGQKHEYDGDGLTYTYTADSGVPLSNLGTRLLYALKYGERNFVLSDQINEASKLLYNRDPRDRVKKAAPWLKVDSKTYPAVIDGQIKWIVDGYTTLQNYPYAQRMSLAEATADSRATTVGQTGRQLPDEDVSYVRNSVKATVDAYTGEVDLYQFDTQDPVLKTWMKVFPGTVKPRADLDKNTDLLAHMRYPEDLFKLQRQLLSKYHVADSGTFYRANNFWTVPADPTTSDDNRLQQPPYYFTASRPFGYDAQYQLTAVMTALNRPNLAAYMTAASDPDGYGKITVKVLPTINQTMGPQQAAENMTSNGRVASDRKLVEETTKVTYGNLLALPVGGNGILYVQPMYTEAKSGNSAIPKLYRVLTYYNAAAGGDNVSVGYAPTVAEALAQVGISPVAATAPEKDGGAATEPAPTANPTPQAPSNNGKDSPARDAAVKELGQALENVRKAQSSGDFKAYGEALDNLDKAIKKYESTGG
ncbi:MAG: UPF0182 family protein [Gordonia sp. (in: high G+C Gram-positive bacteria)]|uniref:UPF0182 family protein n=1 Tax=Gordonia sp. (in: high G+C Gram-positive bacteria) TaxID=84139 RepID=UPI003C734F78